MAYLNKIQAPEDARGQIHACSDKLQALLKDYEKLKNGTMIYKQFFNIYGKEFGYQGNNNQFQRGGERVLHIDDREEAVLQPECIQINYTTRSKLKATPRVFVAASPQNNDKEVNNMREEIHLLKKNIEDMKKRHDMELTN
jgi:hypothetical protein